MLKKLTVSNLAVVERAEVEFGPGLNVITGETGAGKSVLMGALELVLGARAEATAVRDGAKEAVVEAEFELGGGKSSRRHVVRRTVTCEGRSRAWIDDESVAVAELRELGEQLVDVHGPRANQRLLDEDFQRDSLCSVTPAYVEAWRVYSEFRAKLLELEGALEAEGDLSDRMDLLSFQVAELEAAGLTDEDETLAERHAAAAHAEEIVENANVITEALGGDRGAADILSALQPKFRAIARHLPAAEAWAAKAEEIAVELQELSRTVADAGAKLDGECEDLASLDERLTLVNRLRRKYLPKLPVSDGGGIAALLEVLASKREQLDFLAHREERAAELRARLAAAELAVRAAGAELTAIRRRAAAKLAKAVTQELRELGFLRADFTVAVEPSEPAAHGCDRVSYFFAPNPGEAARPLAAIASSGEIARVMLAIKAYGRRAKGSAGKLLVFDEIDANIGGEIGRTVGEKLHAVAAGGQVIAITHLPQSAVFGDRHLVVAKRVAEGRTRTTITEVVGEARVREIARMLGGEELTSVTKRHAEELLGLSR